MSMMADTRERPASELAPVRQTYDLMPVVSAVTLVNRQRAVQDAMTQAMVGETHYGKIPGTEKPTLLKPGAELLCTLFGLAPRFNLEETVEDWTGEEHNGEALLSYTYTCQLWRGDWMVASASGSCNSWEKKYRWKTASRKCPECGEAAIMRGKGGSWYCASKKGGCGANFEANDPRICTQKGGLEPNPDVFDLQNTLIKMSQKRALIGAVLIATGASSMFTQDMEDLVDPFTAPQSPARPANSTPAATRQTRTTQPTSQAQQSANKTGPGQPTEQHMHHEDEMLFVCKTCGKRLTLPIVKWYQQNHYPPEQWLCKACAQKEKAQKQAATDAAAGLTVEPAPEVEADMPEGVYYCNACGEVQLDPAYVEECRAQGLDPLCDKCHDLLGDQRSDAYEPGAEG